MISSDDNDAISHALTRARALAMHGDDTAAKHAYVDLLHVDPTHFAALNELGALAAAGGHRSAARTVYAQLVRNYPDDPVGYVNLGNLLLEDGEVAGAREHYQAALDVDPEFPEAHQGLARVLTEFGDPVADQHWHRGFADRATINQPYRGAGPGIPMLLLVSARGGNIRTQQWIHDRRFAITAIYTEFYDPALPLPPHRLVVNAIGDAELCDEALMRAQQLVARTTAPVINSPAMVSATGRAEIARRLSGVPGVIAPVTTSLPRLALLAHDALDFPLLLRAPGFHTGQHFRFVEHHAALTDAVAALPGDKLLLIQYLNARGPDGMARKYRVMFIDGVLYPLHLAISADWKVHYFTAAMATNAACREEERHFLDDMPAVLGQRAMAALAGICTTLGLDYAGIDFALSDDGSVLLFEANATMAVIPPGPAPLWDYRRPAAEAVSLAVTRMLAQRLQRSID
jgi:TPR repeat/Tetratricopeptide repeat